MCKDKSPTGLNSSPENFHCGCRGCTDGLFDDSNPSLGMRVEDKAVPNTPVSDLSNFTTFDGTD